jgi:hypothetical protein
MPEKAVVLGVKFFGAELYKVRAIKRFTGKIGRLSLKPEDICFLRVELQFRKR